MSMDHDEMIAVIQAHKEGKEIQFRCVDDFDKTWTGYSESSPSWDFSEFEYRIKPEPRKPREVFLREFDGGRLDHARAFRSEDDAVKDSLRGVHSATRKFIEVIEDQS